MSDKPIVLNPYQAEAIRKFLYLHGEYPMAYWITPKEETLTHGYPILRTTPEEIEDGKV